MFSVSLSNSLRYDADQCIGCGRCEEVCPHGVFAMSDRVARLVRPWGCMECGACRVNCPTPAIEVESGVGCAWAMMLAAVRGRRDACACG